MKNHRGNQRDTLVFIAISIVLMLIADQTIFGGKRSYVEKIKEDYYKEHPALQPVPQPEPLPDAVPEPESPAESVTPEEHSEASPPSLAEPEPDYRDLPPPDPILPINDETFASSMPEAAEPSVPAEEIKVASLPPVVAPAKTATGKIAIVIDDVGMNLKNSRAVMDLPAPITLAFLPYADHTRELAAQALAKGHVTMIHMPMEATGSNSGLGPMALRSGMDTAALNAEMDRMFASFEGYTGVNNHMGSKLTQDAAAMDVVMRALKDRNLYFLDSRTIGNSVAADRARMAGIAYATRDIFLDHEETASFVAGALAHAERLAKSRGVAIAIGHPKDVTIEGLRAWIPTLKDKGLELVPVSAILMQPSAVAAVQGTPAPQDQPSAAITPAASVSAAPAPQPAPQP